LLGEVARGRQLAGWGDDAWLDSYHDERQPTGQRNCRAAEYAADGGFTWRSVYHPSVLEHTTEGAERRRMLAAAINTYQRRSHEQLGIEIGQRYTFSKVIAHQPGPLPDPDNPTYVPCAAPGSRLPHLWAEPGVSVHDLLGPAMSLLALDPPPGAVDSFVAAATDHGIPLDVRLDGRPELPGICGARLLLVGPDLHVAWRGDDLDEPADPLLLAAGRRLTTKDAS
jgi:hypothetical protein